MAEGLSVFIQGRSSSEDKIEMLSSAYDAIWLWAPDDVITTINDYWDTVIKNPKQVSEGMRTKQKAFAKILLQMRRDAGFENTGLTEDDYRFIVFKQPQQQRAVGN